jgi:5-methylcytosine-specific restriction endonuclease McrA
MEQVLVLNADYTPLNVTTLNRGVTLVFKGKAEVLKASTNPLLSSVKTFIRPLIIRLLNYVNFNKKKMKVNRHRIYKRDGYQCVYCGSNKVLTIDHVMPRSRGGRNTWTNLVTCCQRCNLRKADLTPEEAGMKMRTKAYEPTLFSEEFYPSMAKVWEDYKNSF